MPHSPSEILVTPRVENLDATRIVNGLGLSISLLPSGAIFAIEVLAIGLVDFQSIVPCLIASIAGDWTTTAAAFASFSLVSFERSICPDSVKPISSTSSPRFFA